MLRIPKKQLEIAWYRKGAGGCSAGEISNENKTKNKQKNTSKCKDQKGKQKQISLEKKNTLGFHTSSNDKFQLWSLELVQAPNFCQGRDQAAERGLPSGSEAPETGKNAGSHEALLRPPQMTTPLHAGKSPFKVPPAPEAAGVRFKANYFNF